MFLPELPVTAEEFHELNIEHRKKFGECSTYFISCSKYIPIGAKFIFCEYVEKSIEMRSLSAEAATVALINKFVKTIDFDLIDDRGNRIYMLPMNQITDKNRRKEEILPIDKYDWLKFEKIFHPVMVYPESDRSLHCKFIFAQLIHINCSS